MACKTVFLDEETRDELLPSHQGVLDSLTHVTDQNGGRVIGLVGLFGSGKTTIVRRLEKESAKTKPRTKYVFVFDTWAHRGDALRKAFVTQLTRFFERENLIDPKRVTRCIARLLGLGKIWYVALTERLKPEADFYDFAQATTDIAGELFGNGGEVQRIIAGAWSDVGAEGPALRV